MLVLKPLMIHRGERHTAKGEGEGTGTATDCCKNAIPWAYLERNVFSVLDILLVFRIASCFILMFSIFSLPFP